MSKKCESIFLSLATQAFVSLSLARKPIFGTSFHDIWPKTICPTDSWPIQYLVHAVVALPQTQRVANVNEPLIDNLLEYI
jgi:hypothetical protein